MSFLRWLSTHPEAACVVLAPVVYGVLWVSLRLARPVIEWGKR